MHRRSRGSSNRNKREIESVSIGIILKYANDKPRSNVTFEQQLGVALMKLCDEEAKMKCKDAIDSEETCNIKHKGIVAPTIENHIVDKNINILTREIDAK